MLTSCGCRRRNLGPAEDIPRTDIIWMYIGKYRISLGRPDIPCRTSPELPVEVIVLYGFFLSFFSVQSLYFSPNKKLLSAKIVNEGNVG